MGVIASWGSKSFVITPVEIVPFEGLSTSVAVKFDPQGTVIGSASSNTKGLELQSISFSTTYFIGAGVDPLKQWEEWKSLVGSVYPLYIGDKRFGPPKMMLKNVNLSDVQTDNNGRFLVAHIAFTFEEYVAVQPTTAQVEAAASQQKAADTYAATVEKKRAMNATASTSDKAAKK